MGRPLTAVPEVRLSANPFIFNNLDDFVNACSPRYAAASRYPTESFAPTILPRMLPRGPGTGTGRGVPRTWAAIKPAGRSCSCKEPQLVSTDDDLHQDRRWG